MTTISRGVAITIALGFALAARPAQADFSYSAGLSSAQQVPVNGSTATGFATISFSTATQTFTYSITFSGLSAPATISHIHYGAFGTNGPIIFDFTALLPKATSGTFGGTLTAADLIPRPAVGINTFADAVAAIQLGTAYYNIHNANFPGGEIRGQVPEPSSLTLFGLGLVGLITLGRVRVRRSRLR